MSETNHTDPIDAVLAALLAHAVAKGVAARAACDAQPYDHLRAMEAVGAQTGAVEAYTIAENARHKIKAVA